MSTRRQPPLQPRSMPSRCVIRGGGWRRSSSSSWWGCSSTALPPTTPTDGTSSRSTSSTSGCCSVGLVEHPAADHLLDGAGDRARRAPGRDAAVAEPGFQVGVVGVPVDLPRHADIRAAGVLGTDPDDLREHPAGCAVRAVVLPSQSAGAVHPVSAGDRSAWRSTRPPTWPKSSVPESVPCRRASSEASTALGMSWGMAMRRTVLPQAMRVIIPPTGNEVISMLKTTSLVTAVPFALDLYGITSREIAAREFEPVPLLLVAAFWYLVVTSILMVGQYYLERYYSRGASRKLTTKQLEALAKAQGTGAPGGGGEGTYDTDGEGRTGLQELRRPAGPEGHHARGRQGRGAGAWSARPARASRRSCAASTIWSRSMRAGCMSTAI